LWAPGSFKRMLGRLPKSANEPSREFIDAGPQLIIAGHVRSQTGQVDVGFLSAA